MENKWIELSESLPQGRVDESGIDILFQSDEWITDYSPKGIKIGFFSSKDTILIAEWNHYFDEYFTQTIKITPDTARQIKWKLIE